MFKNIINYIKRFFKKESIIEETFNYNKGYNYITQDSVILDKNNSYFKSIFKDIEYPDDYFDNMIILKLWVSKPKFKNNIWVGNENPKEGILTEKIFNETNPKHMIVKKEKTNDNVYNYERNILYRSFITRHKSK